jgi:hypothetical protein
LAGFPTSGLTDWNKGGGFLQRFLEIKDRFPTAESPVPLLWDHDRSKLTLTDIEQLLNIVAGDLIIHWTRLSTYMTYLEKDLLSIFFTEAAAYLAVLYTTLSGSQVLLLD